MITAVISKKGGVGKTTTSVNLSAALARAGHRVLLIDLDPNAGASMSLGVTKAELPPSSADLLLRNVPPEALIRETESENLFLLTASVDLRGVEVELGQKVRKDAHLTRCLRTIRNDYDYIFLDCPSSIGLLTRNAIAAADTFLIPAPPQFLATDGLEHLISTAQRVGLSVGSRTDLLGVLVTLADYRLRTTREIVANLRQRFGRKVFMMEIRNNVSLAEAPGSGQTIFQYKPYATGAKAYQLLAEEVVAEVKARDEAKLPEAERIKVRQLRLGYDRANAARAVG